MTPEIRIVGPNDDEEACWHVFTHQGAELHPQLAALLHRHGAERPDLDIAYGDEAHARAPAFDETLLVAQGYIGLPVAVRGRAMRVLRGLDASAGTAQIDEMLLRAKDAGLGIGRIAEVLGAYPAGALRATMADRMAVLRRQFAQSRPDCEVVPGLTPDTLELRRRFDDEPDVTVLVLPESGSDGVLQSLGQTDWPLDRLHVLTGDACAGAGHAWPFHVRHVPMPAGSSQPARANRLWQESETEPLVFLDSKVRTPGWLRALLTFALDEGVGAAGTRRWTAGTGRLAAVQHECPAVAGTLATRRSVLDQANGWSERLGVATAQADLCFRLRLLGLRIVYTPHAGSGDTRCHGAEPDETALFLEKWQHFIADDPD